VEDEGLQPASRKMSTKPLTRFIWCWDDRDVEEANIQTPVAYYECSGEVYVNMQHPIVAATRKSMRATMMSRRKGAINDIEIEHTFRASCESFLRQSIVTFIAGADYNSAINPSISRLQALSDEALSALFGLMELPHNLEMIMAAGYLREAA
jgi:hypothetical protein